MPLNGIVPSSNLKMASCDCVSFVPSLPPTLRSSRESHLWVPWWKMPDFNQMASEVLLLCSGPYWDTIKSKEGGRIWITGIKCGFTEQALELEVLYATVLFWGSKSSQPPCYLKLSLFRAFLCKAQIICFVLFFSGLAKRRTKLILII